MVAKNRNKSRLTKTKKSGNRVLNNNNNFSSSPAAITHSSSGDSSIGRVGSSSVDFDGSKRNSKRKKESGVLTSADSNNIRTDVLSSKGSTVDIQGFWRDYKYSVLLTTISKSDFDFDCNLFCHIDYLTFKGTIKNFQVFKSKLEGYLGRTLELFLKINENERRLISRGRLDSLSEIWKIDQTVNLELGQNMAIDNHKLTNCTDDELGDFHFNPLGDLGRDIYLAVTGEILSQLTFFQQIDLIKFLSKSKNYKCTRIDIALDVKADLVPFDKIINSTFKRRYLNYRTHKIVWSQKLQERNSNSCTVYLGSGHSHKMARIYQTKIKHPELPDMIRFEMVLRDKEAEVFFSYLANVKTTNQVEMLNAYRTCIKKSIDSIEFMAFSKDNVPMYRLPWWDKFKMMVLGLSEEIELPLVPKREKVGVNKNVEWFNRQALPSLSAVFEMFKYQCEGNINDAIEVFLSWLINNIEEFMDNKKLCYPQRSRIKAYKEYSDTVFYNPSTKSSYTGLDYFLDNKKFDCIQSNLAIILDTQ